MSCFNALWGYVGGVLKPHGVGITMSAVSSDSLCVCVCVCASD